MDDTIGRLLKLARDSIRGARILLSAGLSGQAASRAYYAMFYIAQALLFSRGHSFSKHSAVISRFGQEFAKTKLLSSIYHRYLIDGFQIRQIADYGITEDIERRQATQLIQHADKFLRDAKSYLKHKKPNE